MYDVSEWAGSPERLWESEAWRLTPPTPLDPPEEWAEL